MAKDSFFDTNVLVFYAKFTKKTNSEIIKKCYQYVKNKKGKFVICYFLEREAENFIKKNKIIHKEVIEKIKNNSYEIGSSIEASFLKPKDIAYSKKLYEIKKHHSLIVLSEVFLEEETSLEMNIEKFIDRLVDEKVIPIEQIDNELVNKIHDIIPNHADCKILACALQLQNREGRQTFLFVTADSRDLDPNGYDYLKEHFKVNYSKENWKFPDLYNLMFAG